MILIHGPLGFFLKSSRTMFSSNITDYDKNKSIARHLDLKNGILGKTGTDEKNDFVKYSTVYGIKDLKTVMFYIDLK